MSITKEVQEAMDKSKLNPKTVEALKEIQEQHAKELPTMQYIGEFKLKDKNIRRYVRIDLTSATRPLTDLLAIQIEKVHGQNNRIRFYAEWKPEKPAQAK